MALKLKRRQIILFSMIISLIAIAGGLYASYYFLSQDNPLTTNQSVPTPTISPTPIPPYILFINKRANYVGTIIDLNPPNEIILRRRDESKLILNVRTDVPIYHIVDAQVKPEKVDTLSLDDLEEGDTLSIYTEEDQILAVFLSNIAPTSSPPSFSTPTPPL